MSWPEHHCQTHCSGYEPVAEREELSHHELGRREGEGRLAMHRPLINVCHRHSPAAHLSLMQHVDGLDEDILLLPRPILFLVRPLTNLQFTGRPYVWRFGDKTVRMRMRESEWGGQRWMIATKHRNSASPAITQSHLCLFHIICART